MASSSAENMEAEFLRRCWVMTPLMENAYPVLVPDLDPSV